MRICDYCGSATSTPLKSTKVFLETIRVRFGITHIREVCNKCYIKFQSMQNDYLTPDLPLSRPVDRPYKYKKRKK